MIWLQSQCVIYQNHMDSVFMSGISGDQELTADGIRDLQSKHFPVSLHGVLISNLCALAVAATFLARFIALSRSDRLCLYLQ